MGIPEGEEKSLQNLYSEIIAENFSTLIEM